MNPLQSPGRNEPCWCGSGRKYKTCHGIHRADSLPGAPLPDDQPGSTWIAPDLKLADGALREMMPGGTPLVLPEAGPAPHAIPVTNWEVELPRALEDTSEVLTPESLGRLRVEVLHRVAGLQGDDAQPRDEILEAIYRLAGETLRTVAALSAAEPRPTMLWNEELDVATFIGRTLLLADHVLVPDGLLGVLLRGGSVGRLKAAAIAELEMAELVGGGLAIAVADGVAMAHQSDAAIELTKRDLADASLVHWVREQLIFEGPTAREALMVRAADDLSLSPATMWFYAHLTPGSVDVEDRSFQLAALQHYDATHDYSPWISQCNDKAVSYFVQRTNERVVTADVFAAEYVSPSLFEARLLHARDGVGPGTAQAAMWADIPYLPHLRGEDLATLVQNEHAIADLRDRVRASLVTARTPGEKVDAMTELAHDLEAASKAIQRKGLLDRGWQGAAPAGFAVGGIMISAFTGGLPGIAGAALSALGAVAPYLGARQGQRRDAAYLFLRAQKLHDGAGARRSRRSGH